MALVETKARQRDHGEAPSERSQTRGHRKIPLTLLSILQLPSGPVQITKTWSSILESLKDSLFDLVRQIVAQPQFRGAVSLAPKSRSLLSLGQYLTTFSKIPNACAWLFFASPTKVCVIETLMSVTQPGNKFSVRGRQRLHYICADKLRIRSAFNLPWVPLTRILVSVLSYDDFILDWLMDWLIDWTTYQPVWGYFMPRGSGITYIVHLYSSFFVVS